MEDAWCLIFEQLQAEDIANCRLVCRIWKHWITRSKGLNRFISVDFIAIFKEGSDPVNFLVSKHVRYKKTYKRTYFCFDDIWKFSPNLLVIEPTEDAIGHESIEKGLLKNMKWLRDIQLLEYTCIHSALLPNILTALISLKKLMLFAREETPRHHLTTLLKILPPLKQIELIRMEGRYTALADDSALDILSKNSQLVPLQYVNLSGTVRKQFSFAAVKNFLETAKFEIDAIIFLGTLDANKNEIDNYMRSKLKLPDSHLTGQVLLDAYCKHHEYHYSFWYDEWKTDSNGERQFAYRSPCNI